MAVSLKLGRDQELPIRQYLHNTASLFDHSGELQKLQNTRRQQLIIYYLIPNRETYPRKPIYVWALNTAKVHTCPKPKCHIICKLNIESLENENTNNYIEIAKLRNSTKNQLTKVMALINNGKLRNNILNAAIEKDVWASLKEINHNG